MKLIQSQEFASNSIPQMTVRFHPSRAQIEALEPGQLRRPGPFPGAKCHMLIHGWPSRKIIKMKEQEDTANTNEQ